MDQPKIERVLKLINLLSSSNNYSIEELASKLDTSYRSIYRYIDTFKESGFVVYKRNNAYHIATEGKSIKSFAKLIHFSEEEAYMVNKLIEGLDNTNIIKQNLRKKLASVYNCTSMVECVVRGYVADNVNNIVDAINSKKKVRLCNYTSANSETIRDRYVEPFGFTTNYVDVWCYDLEDNKNKLFKVARIQKVETLDEDWTCEEFHQNGYIDVFRISGQEQYPVKLKLGVLAKGLLLEEYPLAERDILPIDKTHWMLYTQVCDYRGVARFVMGLADDIEIVDTPELKKYISNFVNTYLKK